MTASRLTALMEGALTPPAEDDDYAEVVLEHDRGSGGFNATGAAAVVVILTALPALIELIAATEEEVAYWIGREARWAAWGECSDKAHFGHTEDTCPLWEGVTDTSIKDCGDERIRAALAALNAALAQP